MFTQKEDRMAQAMEKRRSAVELSQSFETYKEVMDEASKKLKEMAVIESSISQIDADLHHYNYVDSVKENLKELKKKNLTELTALIRSLEESLVYFGGDPELNAGYIADTRKLVKMASIQMNNVLMRAMKSFGEAFVTKKEVKQALEVLEDDIFSHFKRQYFSKRKDECYKKLGYCREISDDIVMSLVEHEISLAGWIFGAEEGIEFFNSILIDYFDSLDKHAILERLNEYSQGGDSDKRWFLNCLRSYAHRKYVDLGKDDKDVYEL